MNSLLISRMIFTAIIFAVAYFALVKVWTKKVDVMGLLSGPSEVIPIAKEERPRIIAKPDRIEMRAADWGKIRVVEVQNTSSEESAYSIWIKISSVPTSWDPDELQILSETGEDFLTENFGGVSTSFDLVKIKALDSEGHPCIYLLLYRLRALETRTFKIKRGPANDPQALDLTLSLLAKGYSEESAPIASQDGKIALLIKPPESLQVKAMSFLIKRSP